MSPKTVEALAKLFDLPERTRRCRIYIDFETQSIWVECEHLPEVKTDENGNLLWVTEGFKLVNVKPTGEGRNANTNN